MKKIVLFIFGFFLILLGIVGWLLPVVPGWPFMFLGLSFIAPSFATRLKRRILRRFSKHGVVFLEEWKKLDIQVGFSTRHFPVFLSKTDDFLDQQMQVQFDKCIHEDPTLRSHQADLSHKFVYLNQVHSDKIAVLDDANSFVKDGFYRISETDGVLTNIRDLTLLVMTADCLPIFLSAGKKNNRWIGLVHAGWRGTQKKIAQQAVRLLLERSHCGVSDIRVILGPRIGKDQYEVGPEFKEYFSLRMKKDKLYFDLAGENKRQLIEAGVHGGHILDLDICTVSENDDFYSFRKEGETAGRLVSFIKKA